MNPNIIFRQFLISGSLSHQMAQQIATLPNPAHKQFESRGMSTNTSAGNLSVYSREESVEEPGSPISVIEIPDTPPPSIETFKVEDSAWRGKKGRVLWRQMIAETLESLNSECCVGRACQSGNRFFGNC